MTLFPHNNTPRDKATYTLTLDAPTKLAPRASPGRPASRPAVASNGELISKTPSADGSRTTWVWDQTKQMASMLALISVGRYRVYESNIALASGRVLHEWSFVDPALSVGEPAHHPVDPRPAEVDPRPPRDAVRALPRHQHRPRRRRRPWCPQLRPRDPGPPVLPHQRRATSPRAHPPVVRRHRVAGGLERHLDQRGHRDLRREHTSHTSSSGTSTSSNEKRTATRGAAAARPARCGPLRPPDDQRVPAVRQPVLHRGSWTLEALRTAIGSAAFKQVMRVAATYGGTRSPAAGPRTSRRSPRRSRAET